MVKYYGPLRPGFNLQRLQIFLKLKANGLPGPTHHDPAKYGLVSGTTHELNISVQSCPTTVLILFICPASFWTDPAHLPPLVSKKKKKEKLEFDQIPRFLETRPERLPFVESDSYGSILPKCHVSGLCFSLPLHLRFFSFNFSGLFSNFS